LTSCFNPRPSQPEGATLNHHPIRKLAMRFQSTPLPTGRSDGR